MPTNDIGPRIGIDGEKEFQASIKAINAQMKALGTEMRAVTAEFTANADSEEALAARNDVLGRSVEAAKNKLSTLDGQLDRQREKLSALAEELARAAVEYGETSTEAARAQNAYNRQYRTVADLESQYHRTRQQLAEFESAMRDAGDAAEDVNESLLGADVLAGEAAWAGIQTAVRAVTETMREAVQVGMEFDASVSDIAATMGTTADSLGELRGFALEMGATTAFTATEAAQALNYMALAGYDAEQSMAALPNVLNLAAAGGMDLASASDMVTDAQTALGLSMEESAKLVDEMAMTATRTNTSVAQLGEAILTVGGTAQFMAGGTREINQVLGALADNSIKGAEGGTKLRNIILSLSSPTEKAARQLEELGVAVFDAEGRMREFSEIFPELQRSLSNLTDQDQIAALGEIFNNRDIAAAQALLGTTVDRWDELANAIDGAAGSAERMAETRLDNLAGDLTLFRSAADGARIALSDSLTPALRGVTQAGTGIMTFVGDFIGSIPLAGEGVAGLTAGLGTLTVGMTAMQVAARLGVKSVKDLTGAIMTSPVAPWAIGIGLAVTAVTALAKAADQTVAHTQALTKSIRESREAYEESALAIQAEADNAMASVGVLEDLMAAENKTAGQKAAIQQLVEDLNESVPGLTLAYDQQKDTLNMTADAVKALAQAEADRQQQAADLQRMQELYREQEELTEQIAQAQEHLTSQMSNVSQYIGTYGMNVSSLESGLRDLQDALAANEAEYDALAEKLAGVEDASAGAQGSLEALATPLAALEEATLYAAGAADTLSDALREQEKSGSLSLETTNELIEAGYASAIAIDEETGAVTLDREEYVRLASAKIQTQLATLEAEKAAIQAAQALAKEEAAARADGSAYWEAAKAKVAMAHADDTQALDLQIAALNRAQASLTSYGSSATTAAKRSSGASKTIKTQAEKDLAAYKELKAELDHEKTMELISEEDYYQRLTKLRDKYLSDAGNVEEYRKVSETIYKADQKALENREKLWQTASDNILKLEEDFQKELSSRAAEISSSYKLFEEVPERQKVAGTQLISNLEDQIASIESFYGNLDALADREVSGDLVAEIRKMGVSAAGELEGLLSLSDEQLSRYSELYGEKQALANQIAMEELEGLRADTNKEILGQLNDVAELYDTNAPALGLAFAQSLAEGMFEGMPLVESMAQTVAGAAMAAFKSSYNRDVEAMMTASGNRSVTRADLGELLAGAVNGINTGGGGGAAGDLVIHIDINGKTLYTETIEDFRAVNRANPETMDDK